MKIIADNTIPYLKGVLEPFADISYLSSKEFTSQNIKEAEILIVRSIDRCDRTLLEGSNVKLITTATIGFDHIDTNYCESTSIIWKNAPGCNAKSVAQYILCSLVYLSLQTNEPLKDKTIGIIGVGHVGKEVEKVCRAMGMKILLNDPPREVQEGSNSFVSLEQIAKDADIITFHTPLIKEGKYPTFHLADTNFFSQLKRTPWFINASRGSVHNTEALLEAIESKRINKAVIDCWENEPTIDRQLLNKTAIATPHIAGFSADGKANATYMCIEEIKLFLGIKDELQRATIPPPENRVIDLNSFEDKRIEQAILSTFNPILTNRRLKKQPGDFELLRATYTNPREFSAYQILHATPEETSILQKLGFQTK